MRPLEKRSWRRTSGSGDTPPEPPSSYVAGRTQDNSVVQRMQRSTLEKRGELSEKDAAGDFRHSARLSQALLTRLWHRVARSGLRRESRLTQKGELRFTAFPQGGLPTVPEWA